VKCGNFRVRKLGFSFECVQERFELAKEKISNSYVSGSGDPCDF
jgi:hypothetical protein